MAKIAVIDSQVAGIAGDMLVSALVDTGADKNRVIDAIFACQNSLKGSRIANAKFVKVNSHGFAATQLQLEYKDGVSERKGTEMLKAMTKVCDSLGLEKKSRAFAQESLKTIIAAEAHIHGEDLENIHLHEASSIDTLADIVGAAVALQDLKLFDSRIFSTSVAVGGGLLKFSHGTTPNPAAAILEIFKGKKFILVSGQAKTELTTPTGAAMLVNLVKDGSVPCYPAFMPDSIGYGAGTKKFDGFANVIRLCLGNSSSLQDVQKDTVSVVETNIDDATGEVLGNLVDKLSEVAKDVTVIPGTTKKSRPSYLIRIISEKSNLQSVLEVLFAESGTLGARVQEVERFVLPRTMVTMSVTVGGIEFDVHVKVAKNSDGKVTSAKPEFEDVKIIASRCQMPVKRTLELVTAQVLQNL